MAAPLPAPRRPAPPDTGDTGRARPPRTVLVAVPPLPEPLVDRGDEIPDPTLDFVRALAVQGYEVLDGSRSVAQLGPLVSVGLTRHLTALRAVRNDRRIVYRDQRRKAPRAAAARIFRVSRVIAEASVVLHVGPRAHATALRLEWAHRHWRATELTVL